jgi:hypothetical protein
VIYRLLITLVVILKFTSTQDSCYKHTTVGLNPLEPISLVLKTSLLPPKLHHSDSPLPPRLVSIEVYDSVRTSHTLPAEFTLCFNPYDNIRSLSENASRISIDDITVG